MLCFQGTHFVFAETLNDLQSQSTTKSGASIETAIKKPKYLPEFDTTEKESYKAVQSLVYKVINLILFVAGTAAVLVIIAGGVMYVVNGGSEDMQTKAKSTILYATIGLVAIFISYTAVENTVRYLYNQEKPKNYQEIKDLEQVNVVEK